MSSPPVHDEFTPATTDELRRFVAENAAGPKRPLYPLGGRTAMHLGCEPTAPGVVVSTANLNRIVDYPARDMTVTVEAGVRLADLQAALLEEKQQLPIDVSQPRRATLGGLVAVDANGPRRYGYGTLRDYLIGVTAVDASGRTFHAGGRVVKNVAGYDLCKLLIGSLGTLAIVTETTFKLRPIPEARAFVWATYDDFTRIDAAVEKLLVSEARPVVLDAMNPAAAGQIASELRRQLPVDAPVLLVGVEGSEREVAWQVERLQYELAGLLPDSLESFTGEDAETLPAALTDFPARADDPLTFRAALPSSCTMEFLDRLTARSVAALARAGNGVVFGHFPDEVANVEQAADVLASLRSFARDRRGSVTILNCDADWKSTLRVFEHGRPSAELMRKVKQSLDPHDLLNRGRMFDAENGERRAESSR